MIYDVIIIGAGAAGLMAAMQAKQLGHSYLILEKNEKPGLKILISGGGRCNFTNLDVQKNHYVSNNSHFSKSALSQFTNQDFLTLVKSANIEFYEKKLGQLFCKKSSKLILNLLLSQLNQEQILTACHVQTVHKNNTTFELQTSKGQFKCQNVIVATGGLSFPKLGASDFGYKIAKQFGHTITPLSPALDGFVFSHELQKHMSFLSGLSLETTVSTLKTSFTEPLLFTHKGISGPSVLKASLYWNPNQNVTLDFLPLYSDLKELLHKGAHEQGKKSVMRFLQQYLPNQLVEHFFEYFQLPQKKLAEISKADKKLLEETFKAFTFTPRSTVGYDKAEVTRGGVCVDELSSQSLESKRVKGLYFIGEVVDVTGLLGGYNFQWAWSSGFAAAHHLRT